jgi:plastocyanin
LKAGALLLLLLGYGEVVRAQQITLSGRVEVVPQSGKPKSADASGVVIWLDPLTRPAPLDDPPAMPLRAAARLVQRHKAFIPHIIVVQAGSSVDFPNDDPFFHNVFSLFEGKRFDLGLYEAGSSRAVTFDRPGICYIFCNIHPQMSAVIVVVQTPHWGISDRSGTVTIPNVPPGRYLLHAWHERSLPETLNSLTREVSVSESAHSFGILRVLEAPGLNLAHKNKYGRDYDNPTPSNSVYPQP